MNYGLSSFVKTTEEALDYPLSLKLQRRRWMMNYEIRTMKYELGIWYQVPTSFTEAFHPSLWLRMMKSEGKSSASSLNSSHPQLLYSNRQGHLLRHLHLQTPRNTFVSVAPDS